MWRCLVVVILLSTTRWIFPSACAAEIEPEITVDLPPLLIEDTSLSEWFYGETPGVQILSRCTPAFTRTFLRSHQRVTALLQLLLPPEYQVRFSMPWTLVLVDQGSATETATKLLEVAEARARGVNNPAGEAAESVRPRKLVKRLEFRVVPNLGLDGQDTKATFVVAQENRFAENSMALTPAHVHMLLQRRTPPLPAWLVTGVMNIVNVLTYRTETVEIEEMEWVTEKATAELLADRTYRPELLGMEQLLSGQKVFNRRLWQAQAELFVRWALDPENKTFRPGFWQLVDRCAEGMVDEDTFRTCFGFGYGELEHRLGDYLHHALRRRLVLESETPLRFEAPTLRRATAEQIKRLKGEWERLAANYVRRQHPRFAAPYEQQATATLENIAVEKRTDPRLLALVGLYHCDRNEDETAVPFLEAAVKADVPRPRVYSELARIQLARARARPAGKDGKLSIGQTEMVLKLVEKAERLWPRDASTMTLAAQALVNSDHVAEPADIARIERAVRDFPNDLDLLWHASVFYANYGNVARARELATRGKAQAEKKPMEEQFDQLIGKLGARP